MSRREGGSNIGDADADPDDDEPDGARAGAGGEAVVDSVDAGVPPPGKGVPFEPLSSLIPLS